MSKSFLGLARARGQVRLRIYCAITTAWIYRGLMAHAVNMHRRMYVYADTRVHTRTPVCIHRRKFNNAAHSADTLEGRKVVDVVNFHRVRDRSYFPVFRITPVCAV